MIKFLFLGLIRDKQRSLIPIIIVGSGVMLATFLFSWMMGVFNDAVEGNARFNTGHLKVMTRAYEEISSQVPNDLCLTNVDSLLVTLKKEFPSYTWTPRIKFGGLLDVPDENGETRAQAPVFGIAADLTSNSSQEDERLQISKSIVRGHAPYKPGEVVISDELANDLKLDIGNVITLISVSANGGMAIRNFTLAGTVVFGMTAMDRGAMIADIKDIQYALDMYNAAGEVLGFSQIMLYDSEREENTAQLFNKKYTNSDDIYSPIMLTLGQQDGLGKYIDFAKSAGYLIVFVFVFAMALILWNTGLMSGIRRYGEVGVRLAMGESKFHIYKSLLMESVLIGLLGSTGGVLIGILVSYYFQEVGIDISSTFKNTTLMMNNVIRAQVTFTSYYIGFIPGILAIVLGTAISGIGIFKRQTATLFKELEA